MNIFFVILSVSSLLAFIGFIWLVITGFRRNVFWGIMVLLFSPITAIIFAALNWFEAKKAFIAFIVPTIISYGTAGYIYTTIGAENFAEINKRLESGELKLQETMQVFSKAMDLKGSKKLFEEPAPQQNMTDANEKKDATAQGDEEMNSSEAAKPAGQNSQTGTDGTPITNGKVDDKDKTATTKNDDSEKVIIAEEEVVEKIPSPAYPKLSQVKPDPLVSPKKKEDPDFVIVQFQNAKKYKGRYFVIYTSKETFLRGLLVKADDKALYLNRKLFGGSFEYRLSKKKIQTIYMLKKKFIVERDRNRLPQR